MGGGQGREKGGLDHQDDRVKEMEKLEILGKIVSQSKAS